MRKRLIALATTVTLAFGMAGCFVQPSATPLSPTHGDDGARCGPQQRYLVLSAQLLRRTDELDPAQIEQVEDVHITVIVQAGSPAPGYRGIQVGTGIGGINPLVISGLTTYSATLCWDLQYPVALLVRIGADTNTLRAYDRLECFLEDGYDPAGDFVDKDVREIRAEVDFAPGADAQVYAQCQDVYVPGGGDMAGVRPPLIPGMVDR
jgi:hypothetical protein